MKHQIPISGEWKTVSDGWLNAAPAKLRDQVEQIKFGYEQNRLSRVLVHGVGWSDKERTLDPAGNVVLPASVYPKEWGNDGVAFLNDYENEGSMIVGPNQMGKSWALAAWTGLRVLPCDPDWPVFGEDWGGQRLICPEWTGPKKWVVASYSWDNVSTMWENIKLLFPRDELGKYAEQDITFGDGRPKKLDLACGSLIKFLCYTQRQHHWEGFNCDGGSFDEQVPKDKWIGWSRGTTTRVKDDSVAPFAMALTGHVLEDRPDTGAAGWVKTDLYDGRNRMGRSMGIYHLSVKSTPAEVVSKKAKKLLYDQWANPKIKRSEEEARAAIARYWGGWEPGGGLLFGPDVWNPRYHVIQPLWDADGPASDNCTLYRVIDYADKKTTCCGWFAVTPKGSCVLYRVLYEKGMLVATTAKKIIEMSHNERVEHEPFQDVGTGNIVQRFEEVQKGERYFETIIDSRACQWEQQGESVGALFERYGIPNITAASGKRNFGENEDGLIPTLKDLMRIDYEKRHPFLKDEETGDPAYGRPRLMFFAGQCQDAIDEIELMPEPVNGRLDKKTPHDFIDVAKYFASAPPMYMGDGYREMYEHEGGDDPYALRR